mmetsp:Transcript_16111/g.34860  ORF Transcript_16111/g.34860 Transcript_16111/m.34860 type:complete len:238 (-) Transcript_16111:645-1358(-)
MWLLASTSATISATECSYAVQALQLYLEGMWPSKYQVSMFLCPAFINYGRQTARALLFPAMHTSQTYSSCLCKRTASTTYSRAMQPPMHGPPCTHALSMLSALAVTGPHVLAACSQLLTASLCIVHTAHGASQLFPSVSCRSSSSSSAISSLITIFCMPSRNSLKETRPDPSSSSTSNSRSATDFCALVPVLVLPNCLVPDCSALTSSGLSRKPSELESKYVKAFSTISKAVLISSY